MSFFRRDRESRYDTPFRRPARFRERSHWAGSGRPIAPDNDEIYWNRGGGGADEGWGFGYSWGGPHRDDFSDRGYDRSYRGYDQAYRGYDRAYRGYDRAYRGYPRDQGSDRDFRDHWQTDYRNPFGDRERLPPMRITRGRPRFRGDGGEPLPRHRDYDDNRPPYRGAAADSYDRADFPPGRRYPGPGMF